MSKELKKGNIVYREEVVGESYRCPYCGDAGEEITYGPFGGYPCEAGDIIECKECGEEFILSENNEEWI